MNIHLRLANYIARYAPSRQKILQYLAKKGRDDAENLLSDLNYDEDLLLGAWIRTFLAQGKWKNEMRQKLLLKGFPKEKIEKILEDFDDEIMDFENMKIFIENFITTHLAKHKSLPAIREKLFLKFPYFKEEILEILAKFDDSASLAAEIEKYQKKYNLSHAGERQKFFASLLRRGFRYPDVKNFLENQNNF